MPNQTLDVNKFFDNNQILSQIKQLKEVNDFQNASIVRVFNSFSGLDSSVKVLNNSTDLLIKLLEYDASERENREKENLRSFRKEKQQRVLESKTTISEEPLAAPGKSSTQTSFAAAVAGALGTAALADTNQNGPSPDSATASAGVWRPLLDLIASGEGNYTSIAPNDQNPNLTKMTIAEAARATGLKGGKGAIGRYQLVSDPVGRARAAGLNPDKDLFSPENQDKIAVYILEKIRRGKDWLSGKISDEDFSEELAGEWGTLRSAKGKVLPGNTGSIGFNQIKPALEKVKKNYSGTTSTKKSSSTPQASASTPSSSKTSIASATTSSSSMDSQTIGETSKTDAPEYNASQLGIQFEQMTPMVSPMKPTSTIPSLMPIDMKVSSANIQEPSMDYSQINSANFVSPNPLGSLNDVIDRSNIDRRQFINNWGIVA